jgi:hypothetical protein
VLDVVGSEALAEAIERVSDSFGNDGSDDDQIFLQPMLERVAMAGVVFPRSPSRGPYFIINYDCCSGLTTRVTSGVGENVETCLKSRPEACPLSLVPVILLARDALDLEFAVAMTDSSTFCKFGRWLSSARGRWPTGISKSLLATSLARSSSTADRIPTCAVSERY